MIDMTAFDKAWSLLKEEDDDKPQLGENWANTGYEGGLGTRPAVGTATGFQDRWQTKLASEPFDAAWSLLKALPEQQMFIEPMPRDSAAMRPYYNAAGVDHPFTNSASDVGDQRGIGLHSYPEIDRFGARSAGTIHPAILSLLQRHSEQMGFTPDLNLATGAEESSALNDRYIDSLIGTLIAQSPRYNRVFYDDQHIDSKYPEAGEAEILAGWDRYGD